MSAWSGYPAERTKRTLFLIFIQGESLFLKVRYVCCFYISSLRSVFLVFLLTVNNQSSFFFSITAHPWITLSDRSGVNESIQYEVANVKSRIDGSFWRHQWFHKNSFKNKKSERKEKEKEISASDHFAVKNNFIFLLAATTGSSVVLQGYTTFKRDFHFTCICFCAKERATVTVPKRANIWLLHVP